MERHEMEENCPRFILMTGGAIDQKSVWVPDGTAGCAGHWAPCSSPLTYSFRAKMSCPLPIGPFGRCVGCAFDEGARGGIREVHIYHSKLGIHRFATINDKGLSKSHGVRCHDCECVVVSLAEGETVDAVSGTTGDIVTSLILITSLGYRYGPYGCPSGRPFGFCGPVLGFFGYCDHSLRAIGCHSDIYSKL